MPVKIKNIDGFKVSTPGGVKAKRTTKTKAKRQAALLRATDKGWKPTGKKADTNKIAVMAKRSK